MKSKRGSEKYYIIISMILGIMILGIALFYLFHEYFTDDELDWEACRQSVILRNTVPDVDLYGGVISAKDKFPLKCKTEVITIDFEDKNKTIDKIREAIISTWWTFGNGEYKIFPSTKWGDGSPCIVSTRIHFDEKVRNYYKTDEGTVKLKEVIDGKDDNKNSLRIYLTHLNDKDPFKWLAGFSTGFGGRFHVVSFGNDWDRWLMGTENRFPKPGVHFPDNVNPNEDLFIIISSPSYKTFFGNTPSIQDTKKKNFNDPYIVFVHSGNLNALSGVIGEPGFITYTKAQNVQICSSFETIPA